MSDARIESFKGLVELWSKLGPALARGITQRLTILTEIAAFTCIYLPPLHWNRSANKMRHTGETAYA